MMSIIANNAFLTAVVSSPGKGRIQNENSFRRYTAHVQTLAKLAGNTDSRLSSIRYEVGGVHVRKGNSLGQPKEGTLLVDAAYPTASVLAEDLLGLTKKYSNFSTVFKYSSLAGVAERIARGLAQSSVTFDVTSDDLRGGRSLRIQTLGTYDGPVNSLVDTVFMPRVVNSQVSGDVFTIICDAVCGEGGCVATDVLELDAASRRPVIATVDTVSFGRAAVEALRLIGANMIACDQGPLFALAVTRGIHRQVTVVGHTDEGGIMRDLLRCGDFGTPFGAVHCGLEDYAGLPAMASDAVVDITAYVDSLALTTAAIVSHCDPGINYNGRWYPTFYSGAGPDTPLVRPGMHEEGDNNMASRIRGQLLAELPKFISVYVSGLAKLFSAEGDQRVAETFFRTTSNMITHNNRHLKYASVSPFFWVEPTSLVPHDFLGTIAEAGGSGALATREEPRTRPFFETLVRQETVSLAASTYTAVMRSARTSWFMAHWAGHPENGLSAVRVRQLDPATIVHPGQCNEHPEVRDRVEAGLSFKDYLWTRGQSPFCAPGELLNLGGTVGFMVNHFTLDTEANPTLEHVPTSSEFETGEVTMIVGRPVGSDVGPSNYENAGVRRARTSATRELAAAAQRVRAYGRVDAVGMPIMCSAPVLVTTTPPSPLRSTGDSVGGGVSDHARARTAGAPPIDQDEKEPQGDPLDAVVHAGVTTGPQPTRVEVMARPTGPAPSVQVRRESDDTDRPLALAPGAAPPSGPTTA